MQIFSLHVGWRFFSLLSSFQFSSKVDACCNVGKLGAFVPCWRLAAAPARDGRQEESWIVGSGCDSSRRRALGAEGDELVEGVLVDAGGGKRGGGRQSALAQLGDGIGRARRSELVGTGPVVGAQPGQRLGATALQQGQRGQRAVRGLVAHVHQHQRQLQILRDEANVARLLSCKTK